MIDMNQYQKEIIADIKSLETNDLNDPLFLLERIKKYDFGYFYHKKGGIEERFSPDYYEFKAFIESVYTRYLDEYFEKISGADSAALSNLLAGFAVSFDPKKYDILVRLGKDYEIYQDAKKALKTKLDYPVNKDALLALAQCYKIESEQYKIKSFFMRSYVEALKYNPESGVNSDIYLAITQAIMLFPSEVKQELSSKVFEAYKFLSDDDSSYGCSQVSGYIAIYLTSFSEQFDLDVLEKAISVTGKHYQENKFVLQTRYAKWLMEDNHEAALDYFENSKIDDNLEYIIALLADINCKAALPLLIAKLESTTDDPIRTEVLLEAIERLKSQQRNPEPEERMIWLFESASPTDRALGGENDSVFVERARKKLEIDVNVYEADQE